MTRRRLWEIRRILTNLREKIGLRAVAAVATELLAEVDRLRTSVKRR